MASSGVQVPSSFLNSHEREANMPFGNPPTPYVAKKIKIRKIGWATTGQVLGHVGTGAKKANLNTLLGFSAVKIMKKVRLPANEAALQHLLGVAQAFLNFIEPLVRLLEQEKATASGILPGDQSDPQQRQDLQIKLQEWRSRGVPSINILLPYFKKSMLAKPLSGTKQLLKEISKCVDVKETLNRFFAKTVVVQRSLSHDVWSTSDEAKRWPQSNALTTDAKTRRSRISLERMLAELDSAQLRFFR